MTTSPSDRAKEVWRACFDGRRSTKAAVDIIAAAVTQAENEKLEEVALLCARLEAHFDAQSQPEAAIISGAVAELATRIRSPKTPKD